MNPRTVVNVAGFGYLAAVGGALAYTCGFPASSVSVPAT